MPARANFLGLPAELRCKIYEHYIVLEDGYHFDFASGKLTDVHHRPIDLALMQVCKLVAHEMEGMALARNRITFKCVECRETSTIAGHFRWLFDFLMDEKHELLEAVHSCIDKVRYDELASKFPQFVPVLDLILEEDGYASASSWGEARSTMRQFINCVLQLTSTHEKFAEVAKRYYKFDRQAPLQIVSVSPEPWIIPSETDLMRMAHVMDMDPKVYEEAEDDCHPYRHLKNRLSAAAAAIHFLSSIPGKARLQIRSILVHEDQLAGSFPESHALGLIPFCQENPRLRVERRVNLWKTVFAEHGLSRSPGLPSARVTGLLTPWFHEALALKAAGMPAASFALVFDGSPTQERCAEIFEKVVQRDIAWQHAWDEWYLQRHSHGPDYLLRRDHGLFPVSEQFIQAMEDCASGTPLISCNFSLGEKRGIEHLTEENPGWRLETWDGQRPDHRPSHWETVDPLPKFYDLVALDYYQDQEGWDNLLRD